MIQEYQSGDLDFLQIIGYKYLVVEKYSTVDPESVLLTPFQKWRKAENFLDSHEYSISILKTNEVEEDDLVRNGGQHVYINFPEIFSEDQLF